jgi:hypothetical protein
MMPAEVKPFERGTAHIAAIRSTIIWSERSLIVHYVKAIWRATNMLKKTNNSLAGIRKSRNNESGMILVIATLFIMLIHLALIGILSRNVSQILSSDSELKQLQAEQLARGAWWLAHQNLTTGGGLPAGFSVTNNNVTYTVAYFDDGNTGPNGTKQVRVRVSY